MAEVTWLQGEILTKSGDVIGHFDYREISTITVDGVEYPAEILDDASVTVTLPAEVVAKIRKGDLRGYSVSNYQNSQN